MNWPALIVITGAALTIYAAGCLAGWCVGRYGWRRPIPLPTIFRRRPADIWHHHGGLVPEHRRAGVTLH